MHEIEGQYVLLGIYTDYLWKKKSQSDALNLTLCTRFGKGLNHKSLLNSTSPYISARECFYSLNPYVTSWSHDTILSVTPRLPFTEIICYTQNCGRTTIAYTIQLYMNSIMHLRLFFCNVLPHFNFLMLHTFIFLAMDGE